RDVRAFLLSTRLVAHKPAADDVALEVLACVVVEVTTTGDEGQGVVSRGTGDLGELLLRQVIDPHALDVLDRISRGASLVAIYSDLGDLLEFGDRPDDGLADAPVLDVAGHQDVEIQLSEQTGALIPGHVPGAGRIQHLPVDDLVDLDLGIHAGDRDDDRDGNLGLDGGGGPRQAEGAGFRRAGFRLAPYRELRAGVCEGVASGAGDDHAAKHGSNQVPTRVLHPVFPLRVPLPRTVRCRIL